MWPLQHWTEENRSFPQSAGHTHPIVGQCTVCFFQNEMSVLDHVQPSVHYKQQALFSTADLHTFPSHPAWGYSAPDVEICASWTSCDFCWPSCSMVNIFLHRVEQLYVTFSVPHKSRLLLKGFGLPDLSHKCPNGIFILLLHFLFLFLWLVGCVLSLQLNSEHLV